jgi:hypothetical protein
VLNQKFHVDNPLIGNMKTFPISVLQSIEFAKAGYRCLCEFRFRANRRYSLRTIFGRLLHAPVTAPRRPERRIRISELHR